MYFYSLASNCCKGVESDLHALSFFSSHSSNESPRVGSFGYVICYYRVPYFLCWYGQIEDTWNGSCYNDHSLDCRYILTILFEPIASIM